MVLKYWLVAHPKLYAALLALLLIIAAFPDVFVRGTSLRVTDLVEAGVKKQPPMTLVPQPPHRQFWHAFYDAGGAKLQSEPMMEFLRYCIQTRNSPYWNPFSAGGSLGPETLIDQKFSAFTVLYAIAAGGSVTYNAIFLLLQWFGVYYVIRTIREHLHLSTLAAVAAGTFFLLNGYSVANIGSNVTANYIFLPFCLHATMSFSKHRSARSFAAMVAAFTLLLSCTFLPTTIVGLIAVLGIATAYTFVTRSAVGWRPATGVLGGYAAGLFAAGCVLAVLYLPVFESIGETGILSGYQQRKFFPAHPVGILGLFTPSHFFESYQAMEPSAMPLTGNVMYHFGVIGLTLAACSLRFREARLKWLAAGCLSLMTISLARVLGVPLVSPAIDLLPVLRNIGGQYWWGAIALPLTLLVAMGVENLLEGEDVRKPVAALLGAGIAAAVVLAVVYGFREPDVEYKQASLVWKAALVMVVAAATGMFCLAWRRPRRAWCQVGPLVVLMFVEFTIDTKFVRFSMYDFFASPPESLAYVRDHAGLYRTMSLAGVGFSGELGSAFRVSEMTSLNMGTLAGYRSFFNKAIQLEPASRWGEFLSLDRLPDNPEANPFSWHKIDLLGVKYAFVPAYYAAWPAEYRARGWQLVDQTPQTLVFENPHVIPRAFIATSIAKDSTGALRLPETFRNNILPAQIASYRNAEVVLRGTTGQPALLVLTDNWHRNWKADLNGTPVPIGKVEDTFRGVALPAGTFEVRMSYQPSTLPAAVAISAVTSIGVLVLFLVGDFRPWRRLPEARRFVSDESRKLLSPK